MRAAKQPGFECHNDTSIDVGPMLLAHATSATTQQTTLRAITDARPSRHD